MYVLVYIDFLQYFVRLINMLSAYPAVYEILADQPLPCKDYYSLREAPHHILVSILHKQIIALPVLPTRIKLDSKVNCRCVSITKNSTPH